MSKVTVCHHPPGDPWSCFTLEIGVQALPAHLAHGDTLGPCSSAPDTDTDVYWDTDLLEDTDAGDTDSSSDTDLLDTSSTPTTDTGSQETDSNSGGDDSTGGDSSLIIQPEGIAMGGGGCTCDLSSSQFGMVVGAGAAFYALLGLLWFSFIVHARVGCPRKRK